LLHLQLRGPSLLLIVARHRSRTRGEGGLALAVTLLVVVDHMSLKEQVEGVGARVEQRGHIDVLPLLADHHHVVLERRVELLAVEAVALLLAEPDAGQVGSPDARGAEADQGSKGYHSDHAVHATHRSLRLLGSYRAERAVTLNDSLGLSMRKERDRFAPTT